MRRQSLPVILGLMLFLANPLLAAKPAPKDVIPAGHSLEERVVEHVTANGMKFLLMKRGTAPVFSAVIRVRVGGVDEPLGETGVAHMYEHMAFKGTSLLGITDYEKEKPLLAEIERIADAWTLEAAKGEAADASRVAELRNKLDALQEEHKGLVVKDELWDTYMRNGGVSLNASTSKDVTSYYVSLPSNRLELWALMEAQRMADPVLREFYSERDVVAEERRMRTDTDPGGMLYEQFVAAAYTAHPYGTPTIGWMQDIQNLSAEGARRFYQQHYSPSNAVAAVVGDFDIDATIKLIDQYFGAVPAGPKAPELAIVEPPQAGERRVTVEWDSEPDILIGYHKPTMPHKDDYVFDVIDALLTRGRTSRLYKSAIKEKKMARYVQTFAAPGARYANLFCVTTEPIAPFTTDDFEKLLYEELDRLKTEPVADRELEKVRNNIEADAIRRLASNLGLANELTYYQSIAGDWRYAVTYVDNIRAVTPDDVMRVAKQYFTAKNRTVAIIKKVQPEEAKGKDSNDL